MANILDRINAELVKIEISLREELKEKTMEMNTIQIKAAEQYLDSKAKQLPETILYVYKLTYNYIFGNKK